jgi:hypothetical protein
MSLLQQMHCHRDHITDTITDSTTDVQESVLRYEVGRWNLKNSTYLIWPSFFFNNRIYLLP